LETDIGLIEGYERWFGIPLATIDDFMKLDITLPNGTPIA